MKGLVGSMFGQKLTENAGAYRVVLSLYACNLLLQILIKWNLLGHKNSFHVALAFGTV